MAKRDLIIRSRWKNSNKTSFADCLLWHISACLWSTTAPDGCCFMDSTSIMRPETSGCLSQREKGTKLWKPQVAGRLWPWPSGLQAPPQPRVMEQELWGSSLSNHDLHIKIFVGFSWERQTRSKPEIAGVWCNLKYFCYCCSFLKFILFEVLWGLFCSWHHVLAFLEGLCSWELLHVPYILPWIYSSILK